MAKAFLIAPMTGGVPDFSGLPFFGCTLCAKTHDRAWGIYIVTGKTPELAQIHALPNVYQICAVTREQNQEWPQLDNTIPGGRRNRINEWLNACGFPLLPNGITYRQAILTMCLPLNRHYAHGNTDVLEGEA